MYATNANTGRDLCTYHTYLWVLSELSAKVGRLLCPPAHHRELDDVQDPPHVALETPLRLLLDVLGGGQHHGRERLLRGQNGGRGRGGGGGGSEIEAEGGGKEGSVNVMAQRSAVVPRRRWSVPRPEVAAVASRTGERVRGGYRDDGGEGGRRFGRHERLQCQCKQVPRGKKKKKKR